MKHLLPLVLLGGILFVPFISAPAADSSSNRMVRALAREKTDIVLRSVGWYGPNSEDWFKNRFPRDWVKPNAFSVIAANWSMEPGASGWPGIGQSCMIGPGGQVLGAAKGARGSEVVLADLPLGPDQ